MFPALGNVRLNCIDPKLLAEVLRPIWLDNPETAGRVKHLEELDYFLGTLAGGYCLFSIESLSGSPSIPLDDRLLAVLNAIVRRVLYHPYHNHTYC